MESATSKLPEWLDDNFLKKVLSDFRNDDTIVSTNFKIGSGFSEHYGSSMFQCKIDFKSLKNSELLEESIDVVIKASPSDKGYSQNLLSDAPFFKTEIEMYTKVIPAMNQLFNANGLKVELGPE